MNLLICNADTLYQDISLRETVVGKGYVKDYDCTSGQYIQVLFS